MYKQGDILLAKFPLSDKPEKSIIRLALIISNASSNSLDKDVVVCQITTRLRNTEFSYLLTNDKLTTPLPQ